MPRVLIVNHSDSSRANTLWREVLRQYPTTRLVVPDLQGSGPQADWRAEFDSQRVVTLRGHEPFGAGHSGLWIRGLRDYIRAGNFDLVHIAVEPWALMAQALCGHVPLSLQGAETRFSGIPWTRRIRRTGLRRVLRTAAGISTWGELSLTAYKNEGIPPSTPTAVLPMGVPDPSAFKSSPIAESSAVFRVLFVGRLVPEKGTRTLVDAINEHSGPVVLRIIGDGPERGRLEKAFRARPNASIQFDGTRAETEVASAMSWAHVVVVPSSSTPTWEEQWGRSAVEAMMSGRPTVVSDSGELPLLIGDENLVFRQGDPGDLANILASLDQDRGSLSEIGERLRGHAARFLPHVVAHETWRFWLESIAHARKSHQR